MTLKKTFTQWLEENPSPVHYGYGINTKAIQLFLPYKKPNDKTPAGFAWSVWHLSDYYVSGTLSGPSLLLIPIE